MERPWCVDFICLIISCTAITESWNIGIIPHSATESWNIRTGSVPLSVCPCIFLHDGWMDFLHIWYHDQALKFGSMPNLSNYDNCFVNCMCMLYIYQSRMC